MLLSKAKLLIMKDFISFKDSQHIYHTNVFQDFFERHSKTDTGRQFKNTAEVYLFCKLVLNLLR